MNPSQSPSGPEAGHSPGLFMHAEDEALLRPGDLMFIGSEGGQCISRLEAFPPDWKLQKKGDLYLLDDDGPLEEWLYQFVPNEY